jgi:hypothetical protein
MAPQKKLVKAFRQSDLFDGDQDMRLTILRGTLVLDKKNDENSESKRRLI